MRDEARARRKFRQVIGRLPRRRDEFDLCSSPIAYAEWFKFSDVDRELIHIHCAHNRHERSTFSREADRNALSPLR